MLTLGYDLLPEVRLTPEVSGNQVTINVSIVENPKELPLNFYWYADESNPSDVSITGTGLTAKVTIPNSSSHGEYYFRLLVTTSEIDSAFFGTYVTVDSNSITPFNIKTDYAAWIDSAVIYEVTPYIFTLYNHFRNIKNKLPEIREMGINTLWIQPVMKTQYYGQGYDIINYFEMRDDLGTEEELKELIETAKSLGMRVLFDLVQNHSSIHHPYAQDKIKHGENSHYFDFYQSENDNAPYSQHYNSRSGGFIYYFWNDLVNHNYNNPEVRRWMIEAAKHWIKKYDIDGYRYDAIWGVNARAPEFAKEMRLALKSMKPEILMLAEDKATWPETFDERFDIGFDWFAEESWVSHWAFQTSYSENSNPTIFNNSNKNNRANLLRNALTNNGNGYAPNAKILRFIGNNDIYHFITHHGLERTKMAAALIFALNGIPMVYNGQEIGAQGHPYGTERLFYPGQTIKQQDGYGLYPFYQRLAEIRTKSPALYNDNFEEINVNPNNFTYAFRRWMNKENVIGAINMGDIAVGLNLYLPVSDMNLDSTKTYYLTDLINGDYFQSDYHGLKNITIPIEKYTTRIMSLADTVAIVVSVDEGMDRSVPKEFSISQNYPNPFNPTTKITFSLPEAGNVKLGIFDALGREVKLLVDRFENAGKHTVEFNGKNLSSGVYFYRVEYQNNFVTKKMILIK
ncbi:hypothetical protein ASZ90_004125 [hydrocarbon metagenome]|uniref:Glycosyl hydrolase family 13 catalytic domain-containing protein n=1 Tax=hydrocarbon metagenome TaxID=938273 RepID=A0A0W8FYV1_9ZZZZ